MLIALSCGAFPAQAQESAGGRSAASSVIASSSAFQDVCEKLRDATFVETEFSEEKTLHILSHPLHSSGTLLFSPQRGVYRVMKEPLAQEMLITRSEVIQKNAEGVVERMTVAHQPAARAFIAIFLSFFSGDQNQWEKAFDVSFSGQVSDWRIDFVARRGTPEARAIRDMALEGHDGILGAMTLTEADGDQTRTTYHHSVIHRGLEGQKAAEAFPVDLVPGNRS